MISNLFSSITEGFEELKEKTVETTKELIEKRDEAYEKGSLGEKVLALATDIVLPLDLAKTLIEKKAPETPEEKLGTAVDVISLIPAVGAVAKIGKISKVAKVGKVGEAGKIVKVGGGDMSIFKGFESIFKLIKPVKEAEKLKSIPKTTKITKVGEEAKSGVKIISESVPSTKALKSEFKAVKSVREIPEVTKTMKRTVKSGDSAFRTIIKTAKESKLSKISKLGTIGIGSLGIGYLLGKEASPSYPSGNVLDSVPPVEIKDTGKEDTLSVEDYGAKSLLEAGESQGIPELLGGDYISYLLPESIADPLYSAGEELLTSAENLPVAGEVAEAIKEKNLVLPFMLGILCIAGAGGYFAYKKLKKKRRR